MTKTEKNTLIASTYANLEAAFNAYGPADPRTFEAQKANEAAHRIVTSGTQARIARGDAALAAERANSRRDHICDNY